VGLWVFFDPELVVGNMEAGKPEGMASAVSIAPKLFLLLDAYALCFSEEVVCVLCNFWDPLMITRSCSSLSLQRLLFLIGPSKIIVVFCDF
jgi:hypothetical protein